MSPKTIALIGVGGHGGVHLNAIAEFERAGLVRLVCVADPFLDSLPEQHRQLTARSVRWFTDYREMLATEPELDAIVICTPIPLHEPMLGEVLARSGARILLEKPAFPTIQQLEHFIALDTAERVRVGYQMVFFPQVAALQQRIADGRLGAIRRVTLAAGWPRGIHYYNRAGWAGRLTLNGQPVFDGPATNALSHSLHNACLALGSGAGDFAVPKTVSAVLARARRIQSYDTAWIRADFGGAELNILMSHAVSADWPFELRVEGERGACVLFQNEPFLAGPDCETWESDGSDDVRSKVPLYRQFLASDAEFSRMPCKLRDSRGCTLLTNAALVSSGGVRDIPESDIEPMLGDDQLLNIRGLEEKFPAFMQSPQSLAELGYAWGAPGESVDAAGLQSVDVARYE